MTRLKRHAAAYLSSLVLGFYNIHGLFISNGYIPVEINDEPSHTFVDIGLFIKFLKQGQFYIINLYNNFGTPVLGDAVAIPWAPHSIFYFFWDPLAAMILIKFVLGTLTMVALYHLALMFQPSRLLALWVAFLSYSNPSFLWFLQHHPHQAVLLLFVLCLITLERLFRAESWVNYLFYFVAVFALLLGSGINGAFLSCIFIGIYGLLNVRRVGLNCVLKVAALSVIATLLLFPHYLAFYEWTPLSARSGFKLFDLPRVKEFTFLSLFKNFYWFRAQTTIHMDWAVHQTAVYLFLVPFAIWHTLKSRNMDEVRRAVVRAFFWLGLTPTLLVYFLLARLDILEMIPLFKSSDVTRVLWLSMIFVNLYIAVSINDVVKGKDKSWAFPIAIVAQLLITAVAFMIFARTNYLERSGFKGVNLGIFAGYGIASLAGFFLWAYPRVAFDGVLLSRKRIGWFFVFAALFAITIPRFACFIYLNRAWRSNMDQFGFMPQKFIEKVPPRSRIAGLYDLTPEAPDQRAAIHDIFGAGGRSIILSGELKEFLQEQKIISEGYLTYNFLPADPPVFARLGIAYVITRDGLHDEEVVKLGWKHIASAEQNWTRYNLYENPVGTSVVYCKDETEFHPIPSEEFSLHSNSIEVKVPAECDGKDMMFSFYRWPGWSLYRGGNLSDFGDHPVFMVAGQVESGEAIKIEFYPNYLRVYPKVLLFCFIILAVFLMLEFRKQKTVRMLKEPKVS